MAQHMTPDEQREFILNIFADFADEPETLIDFIEHAGMDLRALQSAADLPAMIAGHSRSTKGEYEGAPAPNDTLTWPHLPSAGIQTPANRTRKPPGS